PIATNSNARTRRSASMPPPPSLSVVMPVYNAGQFLSEALDSVLSQSFTDFELIAINDGSTDDSAALLAHASQADQRLRPHHQPNRGLIATLNHGCQLAQGKYIARIDADDAALPHR